MTVTSWQQNQLLFRIPVLQVKNSTDQQKVSWIGQYKQKMKKARSRDALDSQFTPEEEEKLSNEEREHEAGINSWRVIKCGLVYFEIYSSVTA